MSRSGQQVDQSVIPIWNGRSPRTSYMSRTTCGSGQSASLAARLERVRISPRTTRTFSPPRAITQRFPCRRPDGRLLARLRTTCRRFASPPPPAPSSTIPNKVLSRSSRYSAPTRTTPFTTAGTLNERWLARSENRRRRDLRRIDRSLPRPHLRDRRVPSRSGHRSCCPPPTAIGS